MLDVLGMPDVLSITGKKKKWKLRSVTTVLPFMQEHSHFQVDL